MFVPFIPVKLLGEFIQSVVVSDVTVSGIGGASFECGAERHRSKRGRPFHKPIVHSITC